MIDSPTPFCVVQMPSMAANLSGWLAMTSRVWRSPVANIAPLARNAMTTLSRSAIEVTSELRRLSTYQAEIPITKNAPTTQQAATVWKKRGKVDGLNVALKKSTSWTFWTPFASVTIRKPSGVCIHELATRIQNADSVVPTKTSRPPIQRTVELTRWRPNRTTPTKADSRKKANMPSAASGAPKMSPTNPTKRDQLVPNWNSMTMPLTTPITKVTAKSFVRKTDRRSYTSRLVHHRSVSTMAMIPARPTVTAGNMKWKLIVRPN